jgi:hypothetical protein
MWSLYFEVKSSSRTCVVNGCNTEVCGLGREAGENGQTMNKEQSKEQHGHVL